MLGLRIGHAVRWLSSAEVAANDVVQAAGQQATTRTCWMWRDLTIPRTRAPTGRDPAATGTAARRSLRRSCRSCPTTAAPAACPAAARLAPLVAATPFRRRGSLLHRLRTGHRSLALRRTAVPAGGHSHSSGGYRGRQRGGARQRPGRPLSGVEPRDVSAAARHRGSGQAAWREGSRCSPIASHRPTLQACLHVKVNWRRGEGCVVEF